MGLPGILLRCRTPLHEEPCLMSDSFWVMCALHFLGSRNLRQQQEARRGQLEELVYHGELALARVLIQNIRLKVPR